MTTLFAFLLQLVPVAIVGFSPSKFWPTNLQRMLVVVALLFSWNSGEVWLNTINAQFWWLSICFLILLTDQQMTSRRRHRLFCVALFLCGLNGVVSAFLLPLFIARAIVERNSRIVKQTLALGGVPASVCRGMVGFRCRRRDGASRGRAVAAVPGICASPRRAARVRHA